MTYTRSNDYKWNKIQSIIKLLHSRGRVYEKLNPVEIWELADNIYEWFINPDEDEQSDNGGESFMPQHWSEVIKEVNNIGVYDDGIPLWMLERHREMLWLTYEFLNS